MTQKTTITNRKRNINEELVAQGVTQESASGISLAQKVLEKVVGSPTASSSPVMTNWHSDWPVCPKDYNPVEWRRALENRDFYLAVQAKKGKEWFQNPRYEYQYSEFVYITPEMAAALLRFNPDNRKIRDKRVDGMARDIQNQRWVQTQESIGIDLLANMQDGQHRAEAIVEAGAGWPIYVTWNLPLAARLVIDSGEKRKINDKLHFLYPELGLSNRTTAFCRAIMNGIRERGYSYTESEIAEFCLGNKDIVEYATKNLSGYRANLQAAVAKGCLWYGYEKMQPFVDKLNNLLFDGEDDPARILYFWVQKSKGAGKHSNYASPIITYMKTVAAVIAHIEGRQVTKLHPQKKDIFEWEEGWKIPASAPSNK